MVGGVWVGRGGNVEGGVWVGRKGKCVGEREVSGVWVRREGGGWVGRESVWVRGPREV